MFREIFKRKDDLLSQVRDNQQPEQNVYEILQNSRKNNFADFANFLR